MVLDTGILITERPGRLRIVRNGALDPNPVAGIRRCGSCRIAFGMFARDPMASCALMRIEPFAEK